MKRWRWALLIFELLLFALILALPQVDLPDFTFHGGTAPIVIKARSASSPSQLPAPVLAQLLSAMLLLIGCVGWSREERLPSLQPRLSVLCTLLC